MLSSHLFSVGCDEKEIYKINITIQDKLNKFLAYFFFPLFCLIIKREILAIIDLVFRFYYLPSASHKPVLPRNVVDNTGLSTKRSKNKIHIKILTIQIIEFGA